MPTSVDHSFPKTTSNYTNFVTELHARIDDAMKESNTSDVTVLANPPYLAVRWNATNNNWDINTGTSAVPVWTTRARYDININGTVGATTANSGSFTTLSASGNVTLTGGTNTIAGSAIVTAGNTLTLTNKTLTSPVISTIVNTGTLTLPTSTDTLVGKATTDTLTNKTLTSPKLTAATSINDANGNAILAIPASVASAVNYILITNNPTGTAPYFAAAGTDTNIDLGLWAKGTGTVKAMGDTIATLTNTQTLTNKTLTSPVISTIVNTGTLTLPTSTDTLVGRATTDTLTNKTLTSPVISTIVNTGTLTLPTSTDTLVGRATTDTLTNKTWNGVAITVAYGGTGATTADTARVNLNVITSTTGSQKVPVGTTAQRDGTPAAGYFRFNTSLSKFEGHNGTAWGAVGGGATGGGADDIFIENGQSVSTNYTITTNKNAMSTGPITVANGVTVTVPNGSRWVIL